MKQILMGLFVLFIWKSWSQVAINTDGSDPDASAILDVNVTDKGVLIPRLTAAQMQDINNPATGLLVFNKDANAFYYFDGTEWVFASADNLGNHKATQNLQMQGHWISNEGSDVGIYVAEVGNVGIGRDDPRYPLDVNGDIRHGNDLMYDDGDNTGRIWAHFTDTENDVNVFLGAGNLTVLAGGDGRELLENIFGTTENEILYLVADPVGTQEAIKFITNLDDLTPDDWDQRVEAMTILGNGNVGIGTNAPQRKLHINDVMRLEPRDTEPDNASDGDIYFDSTGALMYYYNGHWYKLEGVQQ